MVPFLYQIPAFGAFDDFRDFLKSTSCETSKTCQVCGSNPWWDRPDPPECRSGSVRQTVREVLDCPSNRRPIQRTHLLAHPTEPAFHDPSFRGRHCPVEVRSRPWLIQPQRDAAAPPTSGPGINTYQDLPFSCPFRATRDDKSVQAQANRTGWKSLRKRGKLEPIENRQLPANPYKMGLPKVRDQEVYVRVTGDQTTQLRKV